MKFHDYHLAGYTVADYGQRITLHLVFDYQGSDKLKSEIEFSPVAIYHFIHTAGAILTDIGEVSLIKLAEEEGKWFVAQAAQNGLTFWQDTLSNWVAKLTGDGYKAWRVESAIGFQGFIVAQNVRQL